MNKTKAKRDIRERIMEKMDDEGRSLTWLAERTGINYNTLHSCLRKKHFELSEENLESINEALGADFK